MDNFVVSARKYRPQKFEEVVGQQSISDTLKLAIKNNKLASAYLFCGPRGVGKTTCARIFAKAINCLNPQSDGEACEECESCRSFNEQRSINIQELNAAANNSVDDIRAIIDQVRIPPQLGKYKVIILDEVHMLSQAAGNALLKTLEEPPSYVIFILATTEKHKIMQTILSRCQIFDFNRMEISDIVGNLKMVAQSEGITYEEAALNVIAQKADGGMRDALSIFDQVSNFSQGNITYDRVLQCINALDIEYYFKMTSFLVQHQVVEAMLLFNEIVNKGFNGGVFIAGLASHLRDLLMSHDKATLPLLNVSDNLKQRYAEQSNTCSVKFLYYAIKICDRCSNEYKSSLNKRLSIEITLIEAAQFNEDDKVGAGLCPATILKPLFKQTARVQMAVKNAPKTQSSAAASSQGSASQTAPAHKPVPQSAAKSTDSKPRTTPTNSPLLELLKRGGQLAQSAPAALSLATADTTQTPATAAPASIPLPNTPIESTDTETDTSAPQEVMLYTPNNVEALWKQFSQSIANTNMPMSARMQSMPLKCLDGNIIEVSLLNDIVRQQLMEYIPAIENLFHQSFGIHQIKLTTKVMPPEVVKVITNPVMLVEKMRKENADFATLADQLQLRIM